MAVRPGRGQAEGSAELRGCGGVDEKKKVIANTASLRSHTLAAHTALFSHSSALHLARTARGYGRLDKGMAAYNWCRPHSHFR